MTLKQKEVIKTEIVNFTKKSVEVFLQQHPNLKFYAFAYDCNVEYGEINLCFNTEDDFQATLSHYQKGKHLEYYQTEEDIEELKYNTGDWEYQCFDSFNIYSKEDLDEIYNSFPDKKSEEHWGRFLENMLIQITESLLEFTKTDIYKKISKTDDFVVYTIDHDEDFDDAMDRWDSIAG